MKRLQRISSHRQQGAVLVVSLLLLLVLTVLALTASQSTRLQERMAGNARDTDLAFQAAEAGLREAEARLDTLAAANGGRPTDCGPDQNCDVRQRSVDYIDFARDDDWWSTNGLEYGGDEQQISGIVRDPEYHTEVWAEVRDTLTVGRPGAAGTAFYVHTAKSLGGTDTATVVLQSVQALRYTEQ